MFTNINDITLDVVLRKPFSLFVDLRTAESMFCNIYHLVFTEVNG